MKHKYCGIYDRFFKRLCDIVYSLFTIIVFSWLFIIVAILVKVKLGSPVIFKQKRPGKDEKIFNLYKFRTMTNDCDENGNLLPDKIRLTHFGKWLRNTSLDELPEVFNVLFGSMSIVGPRPLLVKYLPLYNEEQRRRHEVRPGLTGYAQINGRNNLSWEEKFKLDVEYVDNISFCGDWKIILRTVLSIFKKDGIDSDKSKKFTIEEFNGYN